MLLQRLEVRIDFAGEVVAVVVTAERPLNMRQGFVVMSRSI